MGIGFENPMGMGMSMGMIFENGYGYGYRRSRPVPVLRPSLLLGLGHLLDVLGHMLLHQFWVDIKKYKFIAFANLDVFGFDPT